MALHPFNLITVEGSWLDRKMIEATLAEWDRFGTGEWTGYSFSWMSALRARVGRAEEAHRLLSIFCEAFVLRNGFHANGDQSGKGYSGFTYRPFTLEGNFLAMNAVHEMLLQSWSPQPGRPDTEVIRIFPACPEAWPDAEFADLRAEGGHRVSARRRSGRLEWLRIVPGRDGVLPVRAEAELRWTVSSARWDGRLWWIPVRKGMRVEARR
jgi:alpha-L-fucosidase 2